MAIFRGKSAKKAPTKAGQIDVKISSKDAQQFKMHTANVHDPILKAVNEDQPFEQAARHDNRRPSYLSQDSGNLKDIFGNPIRQADMSNPTRERNERPLDTIRGFEYAITGDVGYRDQLESHRLGWGFHEDFPYYNLASGNQQRSNEFSRPVINFDQPVYQTGNYSASSLQGDGGKKAKKKRGLFGRKK
ncbi:uncharacterized protein SPAPADRAFT_58941 [Spathaspora passalidarum NRRL Y-27907]|uniref:Uncharacterized protein n=1 Tax=Spathaspora passalidarum (strain NRRL Y-27907 / 11-Y1) TaxID=619300 RepID=G3AES6_SPAPN|nr:uncharacterized protein SPAPADRAFT_58941 [Spathaspora passalidarum NRRL Y-27907]EGW35756.1 hypothetical protein SPAPADRAFT_58941 [Spathaspora passalidarum NRRL Y-27907]